MKQEDKFREQVQAVYRLLRVVLGFTTIVAVLIMAVILNPGILKPSDPLADMVEVPVEIDEDLIEDGIHVRTGLIDAEGLMAVVNNCTNCHSAKLLTQNRMSADRWNATIKWMQETQNLWDLGGNQEIIVNYLVSNYPVTSKGRRMALTDIEWYELETP